MSERLVKIAIELQLLGVSGIGVADLLTNYPPEQIEAQLRYLPFRKARRKEALIIDAIRNNYSPPKEFYYASNEAAPPTNPEPLDEDPQRPDRSLDADPQGYGATDPPQPCQSDDRLEPGA
jgi:hypothetical protein